MNENNKNFAPTELVSSATIELLYDKLNSLPENSNLRKEFLVIAQNVLKESNTQTNHSGRLAQHIWAIEKMLGRNPEYYSEAGQD